MNLEPVIGLEIHAQLATKTKIFCACPTEFGGKPNAHVCHVCSAQPGALPVLNEKAVEYAVKAGLALNCTINSYSEFARKNYFYPDLPKGYQISQSDFPICGPGKILIEDSLGNEKTVHIHHIHMEEDAGKNIHHGQHSYVNLNRAGVPLVEIVTEPDMNSAQEAVMALKKVHSILTFCEVCNGNMQEGNLRCDVNISLREKGSNKLNTRVEIKNVNSFKFVEEAIAFEIDRQTEIYEEGGQIDQETRMYDADQGATYSLRSKEDAHDYRYFPDPDLPALKIKEDFISKIKSTLPELPDEKKSRYEKEFKLKKEDAKFIGESKELSRVFESLLPKLFDPIFIANWLLGDIWAYLKSNDLGFEVLESKEHLVLKLLTLIKDSTISGKIAKSILAEVLEGGDPEKIIKDRGLVQVSNLIEIEKIVKKIMDANPDQVAQYREGKVKVFGFFVGQIMKESQGKINPEMANGILKRMLDQ